nr:hypothetical protein [Pseudomonas peli]
MTDSLGKRPRLNFSRIAIYATLLLAAALYLVPLVVMLLTSFKTPEMTSHRQPSELAERGHRHRLGQGLGHRGRLLLELG